MESDADCSRDWLLSHVPRPEPDRFMRKAEVLRVTGMGKSTMYKKIAHGRFPSQFRIFEVGVRWRESEVVAWMNNPT